MEPNIPDKAPYWGRAEATWTISSNVGRMRKILRNKDGYIRINIVLFALNAFSSLMFLLALWIGKKG